MTMNRVHPYRKPMSGPMDSRRKTYWPPARGYMAARSPYARAPSTVITPAASHASMSQSGELTVREMSAETMKIPDPIMDPATSIVASVRDRALTNPPDDALASPVSGMLLIRGSPQGVGKRPGQATGNLALYGCECQTSSVLSSPAFILRFALLQRTENGEPMRPPA